MNYIKAFFLFVYRHIKYLPTVLLLVALLCAFLSQYIAPSTFMLIAYFGLAFPVLLVFALLWAVVLLVFRLWKVLLLHLLCLFTLPMARQTFPLNLNAVNELKDGVLSSHSADSTIKVLSYNVEMFSSCPNGADSIVKYLCKVDADICFIQEYNSSVEKKNADLFRSLLDKYPYNSRKQKGETTWGTVLFSKYPIIGAGIASKGDIYNTAIYSDILIQGDTVRAINCHLISNHLTMADKNSIRQIGKENGVVNDLENTVQNVDNKFLTSYVLREAMANDVAKLVQETNYKIVLTGDFNDVPISYAYNRIKGKKLRCAKEEVGVGYNHTFNELPFFFCIDHIMYSEPIKCVGYYRDKVDYSDHYPTVAILLMK